MKRILTLSATALVLAVSLSGCGEEDVDQDPASAQSSQQPGSGRPGGGQPGSGKVAAVDGTTAQVQGSSSQTAVTWTSSTTFTQQVAGSLDDVTAGSCVIVSGEDDDTVTASSVRITEAEGDDCSSGLGGPGGDRPDRGDMPQDRPSEAPTDRPSDAPRGMGGGGGMAAGRVTAVTDTGFTVASTRPGSDETGSVTVAVTDATTYTTTEEADAEDVKVGVCVQTRGESDSKGAVTATSIAISPAADGECVSRGPGGRGSAPEDEDEQDEAAAA